MEYEVYAPLESPTTSTVLYESPLISPAIGSSTTSLSIPSRIWPFHMCVEKRNIEGGTKTTVEKMCADIPCLDTSIFSKFI